MIQFPQVLLLGNGLNRAYNAESWSDLIERIHTNQKVNLNTIKKAPFPLQAVLATEDRVDVAIRENQTRFCGAENVDELKLPIQKLLSIPFDHIITTNYSYEIERIANSKVQSDGQYCKKLMRHTGARADVKYLLHTYNEITYQGMIHKIWHIHGEIRKPQSVVLGHYYYGNLLGRYQKELNERGNQHFFRQQKNKPIIIKPWIDAFIMGDVYVLGFGLDFSEMDIWWLLNRKKREHATHGGFYFYEPAQDNEVKAALLGSYGGEFRNMGYWSKPSDYKLFYKEAIADIRSSVNQRKERVIYNV